MATTEAQAIIPAGEFAAGLARIRQEAESIVVKDGDTCLAAKTAQRDVRAYIKDVKLKLDPFVESAKQSYDRARDERNKWIQPAEMIDDTLARKVKDYEAQERERAAAEERRINEERRRKAEEEAEAERKRVEAQAAEERKKRQAEIEAQRKAGDLNKREAERLKKEAAAAEERAQEQAAIEARAQAAAVVDVKVAANIPTVAGVPSRVNWKFKVVDAAKIPRAFLIPNEKRIGEVVRSMKDKTSTELLIPGIEVYQD